MADILTQMYLVVSQITCVINGFSWNFPENADNCFGLQVEVFHKDNGLSEDLLVGCKVVLRERKVVLGLMSKCESISSKMVKQVTMVMERGTASVKQPALLNSQ